jgi:hypothetical protein
MFTGPKGSWARAMACGNSRVRESRNNDLDMSERPASDSEVARWASIENGVRQDAARLARLVLEGQASSFEAQLLARRIDSVRTAGIGAEY